MAVYSYTPKVITGPLGTTYDFFAGDTQYTELGIIDNVHYIDVQDTSLLPTQDSNIQFEAVAQLPTSLLTELKTAKALEIKTASDIYDSYKCDEMFITSSLGYKINADIRSQKNIESLIAITADDATVSYKDYDNNVQTLTKADLLTLSSECIQNGLALYQQKWAMQAAVEACTTKEQLDAVIVKFEMMDFIA